MCAHNWWKGQLYLAHDVKKQKRNTKNKNRVAQKNGLGDSSGGQSRGELKLWEEGFVKQVGFKPRVKEWGSYGWAE